MEVISVATIEEQLKEKFGDAILSVENIDMPVFTIKRESLVSIFEYLYQSEDFKFQFLTTMCGLHYPFNVGQELGMMYQLHSWTLNIRIRFKLFFPLVDPNVHSLTHIFKTADWMEREAYDFFGIHFKGHKDMRRILNVDDMKYFPMRKEIPLEDQTREDKDDTMFGRL